ncbi:MAG TPA: hypothetical protein PKA26_12235, partial [bacterium]|nr:hypothetical protein [bacterium]
AAAFVQCPKSDSKARNQKITPASCQKIVVKISGKKVYIVISVNEYEPYQDWRLNLLKYYDNLV